MCRSLSLYIYIYTYLYLYMHGCYIYIYIRAYSLGCIRCDVMYADTHAAITPRLAHRIQYSHASRLTYC